MSWADSAFAASGILWDDHEGGESTGEEDRDRHDPEPVQSITKIHTAYRSVESDFYILSISKYGKQNILNLECNDSVKQMSIADLFGKSRFAHRYWSAIYCLIFRLSGKYIIFILCSFLMFVTHLMLSCNCHFTPFIIFFSVPSETRNRGFTAAVFMCLLTL